MINILIQSIVTVIMLLLILLIIIAFVYTKTKHKNIEINYTNCNQKKAKAVLISRVDICYDNKISIFNEKISFFDFYNKLKSILKNDKIETIIIDADTINLTNSQIEELSILFDEYRDKKEIITIATIYDKNTYNLALLGNKIYAHNTTNSSLNILGYKVKNFYLKSFFDMVGVNFILMHVGKYKGAYENYTRDTMSDEVKKNLQDLYESNLNNFINRVKKYRNIDITEKLLNGELINVIDNDLIDKKVSLTKFLENTDNLIEFKDYEVKREKKSKNIIGLITLDGVIAENDVSFEQIYKKVNYFSDKDIKGLVIEINSPGGSAYEAYRIYSYIKESFDVPIYISMKDVCASGGYYIASVGKKIYAKPSTITGSIGVVLAYPTVKNAMQKAKINYDGIEKGIGTDIFDFTQQLSENSINLLQKSLNGVYKEFKTVVMKGRLMTENRLEPIAQGLVWIGNDAKNNGLVDKIGGTNEAIQDLANFLKLENYTVKQAILKEDIKNSLKQKVNIKSYSKLLNKPLMLCTEYFNIYN